MSEIMQPAEALLAWEYSQTFLSRLTNQQTIWLAARLDHGSQGLDANIMGNSRVDCNVCRFLNT